MQSHEESRLERIILKPERRYPFFKKMDIYATVKNAYKKAHSFFKNMTDKEFEEIEQMADRDLQHSL